MVPQRVQYPCTSHLILCTGRPSLDIYTDDRRHRKATQVLSPQSDLPSFNDSSHRDASGEVVEYSSSQHTGLFSTPTSLKKLHAKMNASLLTGWSSTFFISHSMNTRLFLGWFVGMIVDQRCCWEKVEFRSLLKDENMTRWNTADRRCKNAPLCLAYLVGR